MTISIAIMAFMSEHPILSFIIAIGSLIIFSGISGQEKQPNRTKEEALSLTFKEQLNYSIKNKSLFHGIFYALILPCWIMGIEIAGALVIGIIMMIPMGIIGMITGTDMLEVTDINFIQNITSSFMFDFLKKVVSAIALAAPTCLTLAFVKSAYIRRPNAENNSTIWLIGLVYILDHLYKLTKAMELGSTFEQETIPAQVLAIITIIIILITPAIKSKLNNSIFE